MAPARAKDDTPAMRQFHRFKKQHPDCVLFFRMGDFYEMFFEDAKLAHKTLGITLTRRTEGIPMAGVPYHAVEGYLRRMIQAGHRVAVCDQLEDSAQAKGVVKRGVTRVITPGTITDESLLADDRENPLAAVVFHHNDQGSVAWAELSTGSFSVATLSTDEISDELARIAPRELLYSQTTDGEPPPRIKVLAESLGCAVSGRPDWQFRQAEATEVLKRQYGVAKLSGFGFEEGDPALSAAGAVMAYLMETQKTSDGLEAAEVGTTPKPPLAHLQPPKRFLRTKHLIIDQASLRSLEVERTLRSGLTEGSLLGVLQGCLTGMGKRLLRHWLCYPLCEVEPIEQRQRVIETLANDSRFQDRLRQILDQVHDVPRITARLSVNRAMPRDLVGLGASAQRARDIEQLLADRPSLSAHHDRLRELVEPLEELGRRLSSACVEAPPAHLREGGLIRDGFDERLDQNRSLQRDSHAWLARYQKELIQQTQISSLKVGYNKIFGYYIEVTAAHRSKAPPDWTRKQTLKNAERFATSQLKQFEQKVLSAESRAIAREQQLFADLCSQSQQHLERLHAFAHTVAELDVLACLARRAIQHRYVKPHVVEQPVLTILGGRHPVLDELLGDQFVPNDLELGPSGRRSGLGVQQSSGQPQASNHDEVPIPQNPEPRTRTPDPTLALITGPNMAGKSTYIRQTALITLLAHTGSFVPADSATIGLCDRLFTRVGASDELHAGQSTFMVEMTEAANICHHATDRSLVILDEIGRGTSTLDGLSLAWAIAEFLADKAPRTLFATHYHELTALAERFANIVNLNVTVREWQDQIVFLHRIAPGGTDRSYGIHVAKIAGMPAEVVERATGLLNELEVAHRSGKPGTPAPKPPKRLQAEPQLPLFTEYLNHPVVEELKRVNLTGLSPMDAFDLLRQIRQRLDEEGERG